MIAFLCSTTQSIHNKIACCVASNGKFVLCLLVRNICQRLCLPPLRNQLFQPSIASILLTLSTPTLRSPMPRLKSVSLSSMAGSWYFLIILAVICFKYIGLFGPFDNFHTFNTVVNTFGIHRRQCQYSPHERAICAP
jgi:hypothetical protein